MDTYTDTYGVERCDECGEELGYCECVCPDCGDSVHECACDEED
jgi:hypothetical protein